VRFPAINFPSVDFRIKKTADFEFEIFDIIRKKFVVLTPEEWVRQHIIHFLINQKSIPASLISVEKQILFNGMKRRTDLVVYSNQRNPLLIIECKEPNVELNQNTINQIYHYNSVLSVPYLLISNGLKHICIKHEANNALILKDIPNFEELSI